MIITQHFLFLEPLGGISGIPSFKIEVEKSALLILEENETQILGRLADEII
jgi:hypothetical protein